MFVGHLGVGLALKSREPKLSLAALFTGVLLLDLLLGAFVLIGLEQVHAPQNYAELHYLAFSFPYSHSLLGSVVWSALAAAVTYVLWAGEPRVRRAASLTMGAAVFSHWICDWIEHPAGMPLASPQSYKLGLGLWNHLGLALGLEVALVALGLAVYLRAASGIGRTGRWGIVALMVLLTTFAVAGQATSTEAPNPTAAAAMWVLQACVLAGIAAWLDRTRRDAS